MKTVPIFEKDGNRLFILSKDFLGKDHHEARNIGLGASLVELPLLGLEFKGEILDLDVNNNGKVSIKHAYGAIGHIKCCIISGPLYDRACDMKDKED